MKSPIWHIPGLKTGAVGISWFRESDYAAALAIMNDPDALPPTYALWLVVATKQESEAQSSGRKVIRAVIDPKTFPVWCRTQGLRNIDASARRLWAADYAARQIGL